MGSTFYYYLKKGLWNPLFPFLLHLIHSLIYLYIHLFIALLEHLAL